MKIMTKRRLPLILSAALFGALVWLSVSMGNQYHITLTAPLVIEDLPQGWAIRTPIPQTIQLRYYGDGWRLALLQLGAQPRLEIPFSSLRQGGRLPQRSDTMNSGARLPESNARILTQHDITDLVPVRTGLQLIDVNPDSIYVEFDRYDERVLPVVLDIAALFREGYGQVGAATVTPESVTVGGAASNIRILHSWKTVRSTFEDLRAPVDADIPLVASTTPPLTISPPLVHVSINVQPFAEKVLNGIPVEGVRVPSNREIIFIPPKIELVARAGIKQLASLVAADFHARIDYLSILADTTGMVDPLITGPAGIQIVSKRPERLQYIVRKRL